MAGKKMSENRVQRNRFTRLLVAEQLGDGSWQDVGLLILRVFAGVTIAGGGMDKLPVGTWFTGDVAELGFPLPRFFAFAAAFSEFAGGWLLVIGLLGRPAAFFLAVTMGVASFATHAEVRFFGLHIARIYFWSYVCLTLTGPGRISIDHLYRVGRVPSWVIALPLMVLAGIGGYRELLVAPKVQTTAVSLDDVTTISLVGNFNDWTLDASPMQRGDDGVWRTVIDIDSPGPIEFKFAANSSWALNCGAAQGAKSSFPLAGTGIANVDGEPANIEAYIPTAGDYEFTFNLDDFAYTLDKAVDEVDEKRKPDSEIFQPSDNDY